MATRLKNTLVFTNVAPGATVPLPHGLIIEDGGSASLVPDLVALCQTSPANTPFSLALSPNTLSIEVTNNGGVAASAVVYVESWHTFERVFGFISTTTTQQFASLSVKPVFITGGGSSSAGPVGCIREATGAQSIPNATIETLVLPNVSFSSPASMGAGPANTIVIPADGVYTVRGNARFGQSEPTGGSRAAGVRVSGGDLLCEMRVDSPEFFSDCIGTATLPLTAGTILEAYALQSSGAAVTTIFDNPAPILHCRFEVFLVR